MEETNLTIPNIPVGIAQMIHFLKTLVVQRELKDWCRNRVLKISSEGTQPLGLSYF